MEGLAASMNGMETRTTGQAERCVRWYVGCQVMNRHECYAANLPIAGL